MFSVRQLNSGMVHCIIAVVLEQYFIPMGGHKTNSDYAVAKSRENKDYYWGMGLFEAIQQFKSFQRRSR
jgi:acetyl-CoA acyltransferase